MIGCCFKSDFWTGQSLHSRETYHITSHYIRIQGYKVNFSLSLIYIVLHGMRARASSLHSYTSPSNKPSGEPFLVKLEELKAGLLGMDKNKSVVKQTYDQEQKGKGQPEGSPDPPPSDNTLDLGLPPLTINITDLNQDFKEVKFKRMDTDFP
uniref:Uncharacterized protein n=1 Tax=Arundo donax TaxID=35708 RepID=A0A0A9DVJ1_ARUDO